ncbi:MAG: thiamine-phosphate kinase [Candidatus Gastranaerophilales bacterium]|nr:thiamine-phosphate kinase [Candidatus Gastranaerophilales bacterium]
MKENKFLEIINKTLSDNSYLGDDCAYLEDLGIFITHDTLVENVHFSLSTTDAFTLAKKAVNVNLSDLASNLAIPKYITVSLSLPNKISEDFVKDFYTGLNEEAEKASFKIIGGDLTGGSNIVISICAIGKKSTSIKVSRKYAQTGDIIVTTGTYGSSVCGLYCLEKGKNCPLSPITAHISPKAKLQESKILSDKLSRNSAIMDTSDGLMDAAFKIAKMSGVEIELDFNKIPYDKDIKIIAQNAKIDYVDWILWGGEDFELFCSVSENDFKKLDKKIFKPIGKVTAKNTNGLVKLKTDNKIIEIDEETFNTKSFNHFEEK